MIAWENSSRRIRWSALLLLLILLVAGWFSISPLVFWSSDTGLRYLQVQELIDHQWRSPAIDYEARFLDPELAHVPYYNVYIVVGQQIFVLISTFFPLVSSLLLVMIGRLGLVLPPVLGGLASGLATYKLARLSELKCADLLFWASVLATPVLFYSLEFWDHTFVTAFSLWAVYFLARGITAGGNRHIFVAGVLAGFCWVQRAEFAFFVAALGLSLLVVARLRAIRLLSFVGGNVLSALPLWAVQYAWMGHPLGVTYAPRLFGYGVPESYSISPGPSVAWRSSRTLVVSRMLTYVESRDPLTFSATLLCLVGLVLIVFALRVPRWRTRRMLLSGVGLSVAGYLLWLVTVWDTAATGIIPMAALLPFSLAVVESKKRSVAQRVYRFVLIATFAFIGLMLLIFPAFGGDHWALRYMLPAYPLLIYLAFYTFEHYWHSLPDLRWILTISFAGLLVLSTLIQFAGVRLLFQQHAYQAQIRDHLQTLPADLIVTNSPFLASDMSSLDKMFLYVDEESYFQTLIPRMWQNKVHKFILVSLDEIPLRVPGKVRGITIREVQPNVYQLERSPKSLSILEE